MVRNVGILICLGLINVGYVFCYLGHLGELDLYPLVGIRDNRLDLNLQAFQIGIYEEMKMDSHGRLHEIEVGEHVGPGYTKHFPIAFVKNGRLMFNLGALGTGLFGAPRINTTTTNTTVEF